MARSSAELANLVAAQRMRAMALGWVAAAVVLGAMATMALGVAMLVWLASHLAGFVFAALAGAAATLCAAAARRSGKRNAQARAKLEEAWEQVADEVLRARGAELTAADLARAMRTDEGHAEALLARLSVSGRARVDVRDDAELAYRVQEGGPADTAEDAEPDGSRARVR
jgi:hypothetical protein